MVHCLGLNTLQISIARYDHGNPHFTRYILQCGKFGYIDKTFKFVIKPQFDDAGSFYKGLAGVYVKEKYGYIDTAGRYIWEPTF